MKILVTGSRGRVSEWDRTQLEDAIWDAAMSPPRISINKVTLIHGACMNSPDETAARIADNWEMGERSYPADWEKYGRKAGYVRNVQMLNLGRPDLVLAQWDGKSRGTLHMITEATAWGVPVRILPPQKRETP